MFLIFRNSFSSQLHSWDVKTNDYCLYTWLTHTQVSESWARRGGCQVPTGPHARQKYHTNQVNLNTSQRTSPFRSVRKHKWCWCWNTKYRKVVFLPEEILWTKPILFAKNIHFVVTRQEFQLWQEQHIVTQCLFFPQVLSGTDVWCSDTVIKMKTNL